MDTVVGIFWDGENVRIPKGFNTGKVCNQIRKKVAPFGSVIEKLYYFDSRASNESRTDRTNLDLAGFKLVDCPKRGHKETIDKKIIVDLLLFAVKHKQMRSSCTVALVSGDGDYSYMLSRLRDLDVQVIVIFPETRTFPSQLFNASDIKLDWRGDIIAEVDGRAFDVEACADLDSKKMFRVDKPEHHRVATLQARPASRSKSSDAFLDECQASDLAYESFVNEFHIVPADNHFTSHGDRGSKYQQADHKIKMPDAVVVSQSQPPLNFVAELTDAHRSEGITIVYDRANDARYFAR